MPAISVKMVTVRAVEIRVRAPTNARDAHQGGNRNSRPVLDMMLCRVLCLACNEAREQCSRCRDLVDACTNTHVEAAFTAVDDPASDPARPPTAANPPQSSLNLPIIEPEQFEFFNSKLRMNRQLTRICQSLRSLKKESDCENPVVEAWYTTDGQNLLDDGEFCPDVLFVRSHYDKLFQKIRRNRRVILTGNPGISKSV